MRAASDIHALLELPACMRAVHASCACGRHLTFTRRWSCRHACELCVRAASDMLPPCARMCAGQQGALLELLEIPSLMDACVRAGSYDDALDLRAYAAKLALLHADLQVPGPFRRASSQLPLSLYGCSSLPGQTPVHRCCTPTCRWRGPPETFRLKALPCWSITCPEAVQTLAVCPLTRSAVPLHSRHCLSTSPPLFPC
jgi:hypothetical protein